MPENIIISSLKEAFFSIWKNKLLFILLLILQISFFAAFFYLSSAYTLKIIESTQIIADYTSQLKLDEASVIQNMQQQKSILGDDPLVISRNFSEIVKNFRIYLIYILILMIIFISLVWAITHKLVYRINFKKSVKIFLKTGIISFFYLGLVSAFFYSIISISLAEIDNSAGLLAKYTPFLIFSIVLIYFMFVSLSLANYTELRNIIQKTLIIGIKKAHYVLSVYLASIFLFAISIFLLYTFLEKNLFILLLSMILLIFSFVFGRILMVKVVEKLE